MVDKMCEIFLCALFGVGIISAVALAVALVWVVCVDLIKDGKRK